MRKRGIRIRKRKQDQKPIWVQNEVTFKERIRGGRGRKERARSRRRRKRRRRKRRRRRRRRKGRRD